MNQSQRAGTLHHKVRLALILPLVALLGLVSPAAVAGGSHHDSKQRPKLTVMTRNLYLGSSLEPAIVAGDLEQLIEGVAEIYGTTVFTDFPTRAKAIAREIKRTRPDLIGLQEVSNWIVEPVANPAAEAPSYDFLTILQRALRAKGLRYSVAGVSNNAEIGPLPLIAPGTGCEGFVPGGEAPIPDCTVKFADRDVILVNDRTRGLRVGHARSGSYTAQQVLNTPAGPLSFDRGWVSIRGRYQGRSFTFVNTHLETEDFPAVQEAQAAEFLAGPARGRQTIAVGDFNSAADGSTTNSYAQLTARRAFTDAWKWDRRPGLTCCQNSTLTNTRSELSSRIDLVLTRGRIRTLNAKVVGRSPFRAQALPPRPIWASDHAGVVAKVQMRCSALGVRAPISCSRSAPGSARASAPRSSLPRNRATT